MRRLAFPIIIVILILAAALSFGTLIALSVYVGQNSTTTTTQPEVATTTSTTTTTTTITIVSTTTITEATTTSSTTSTTGLSEADLKLIEASNRKYNSNVLNLTYISEGGNQIRLWTDSVAFKVNVQNLGDEMGYVEVSAQTNRGVKLKADPQIYNSVPGDSQDVVISVLDKDVRNCDEVAITAKILGRTKTLELPVNRSSDKYSETVKSGRDQACGAAGNYDIAR